MKGVKIAAEVEKTDSDEVPKNGQMGLKVIEVPDGEAAYDAIRKELGIDLLEVMSISPELVVIGDEEAKLVNEPVENAVATKLVYGDKEEARKVAEATKQMYRDAGVEVIEASSGDPREPFVAGDVMVFSQADDGRGLDSLSARMGARIAYEAKKEQQ